MFTIICGSAVGLIFVFGIIKIIKEERLQIETRKKRCCQKWANENLKQADKDCAHWAARHPFANSSHPEAQRLHTIRVGAYMLWLDAHDLEADDGQLEDMLEEIEDTIL
jgi:hypothetical protein